MSKNKSKMFPSVSSHDDKHKDDLLSSKSGITKEKDTNTRMIYMDQMKKKNRQVSKIGTKSASVLQSKDLLPSYPQKISKPVDSQFRTDRLNARQITHNFPLTDLQDFKDISKNGKHNTTSVNENHGYLSQSYSGRYHTDTSKNSENKSISMKKSDSKEALHNYLPSEEAGSTNNKMKDAVSKIIESIDLNTDDNFPSKTFQDSSKTRHHSTTITKKNYLSRSLSVPNYGTDTNPNVNQLENYDNFVYKTSQKGIGSALSEKDFQTLLPTYTNGSWNYSGTKLNKDRDLRTLTRTGFPLKVSNQGKFDLQTNDNSIVGLDLNVNQEAHPSNNAFYDNKLQISKMKEKTLLISLSPNWVSLLSKHFNKVIGILNKLLEENINFNLQNDTATVLCINTESIKSLLENDLTIIDHDPNEQSWLKANFEEWKSFIDYLESKYFCFIFSEKDFSKTYIGTNVAEFKSIDSIISQFRDQCPTDVKISHQVMEILKYNKTFSDLKLQVKTQDEIWIRNVKRCRLAELKKEMKKVTCQSYLLNENEYEFLCEKNNEVLSHVEEKFHVKGRPYQLPMTGDIPIMLQVNQLISISCVVNSDPENIPLDSLINVEWQTSKPVTGIPLPIIKSSQCSLKQCFLMQIYEAVTETEELAQNLKESLSAVFNEEISPVTIGICFHLIPSYFDNFCLQFLEALQLLKKTLKVSLKRYIVLIVPEEKMRLLTENTLKIQQENHSQLPRKTFVVKVVQGNLADQEVDIIVNSTNNQLELKCGQISSSLLKKAGSCLQKECLKKCPNGITFPDFVVTSGYKLSCKYIIHVALPANNVKVIRETVYLCLDFARKCKFSSIAFPALGTGNLKYPIDRVVQEMNEAFKMFQEKYLATTLEEIKIVLYSKDMGLDMFFQLDNSQRVNSENAAIKEQQKELPPKSMNWIQFMNYSYIADNLSLAIKTLGEQLKHTILFSVKIPLEEFEDVFFFNDLLSMIPDIVQQLGNQKEKFYHFHLSAEARQKLKTLMQNVKDNRQQEQLHITQPVNKIILDHCLLKARQTHPLVKFIVTNSGQSVIIQSLDWDLTQEAKFFLEVWLGMKSSTPVSIDRFDNIKKIGETEKLATLGRDNKTYHEDSNLAAAAAALPAEGIAKNVSQSTQTICCFQTGNGLLVKVYQADILNVDVDGIVNAANKWLCHGGGVARAIIKAAGDVVNTEGQRKLNGKTLNDGEVLSTSAGNLRRYKNIIHAVGPMYNPSKSDDYCLNKITTAVLNSLCEAVNLGLQSVALPALSSAIFGVPMEICTQGYCTGIQKFSRRYTGSCLKEVHFVDLQEICIKEIQMVFNIYFILISEDSNNFKKGNSLIDVSKPSSASKEKSVSPMQKNTDENCPICLESPKDPTSLEKCKHTFCTHCIEKAMRHNPRCPLCLIPYGIEIGSQPPGKMKYIKLNSSLPGYTKEETFYITYEIRNPFSQGIVTRYAYLPATEKGTVVLKMLQLAFERKLVFTFGESRTTGTQNVITWNDIHHKTTISGGPQAFGYPDPTYLERVTNELASHGITPDDVANESLKQNIEIL